MPHIMVKLVNGRTEEQKKKLTAALVRAVEECLGTEASWVSVGIEDYSWDDWCKKIYPTEIGPNLDKLYKKPDYQP